MNWCRDLLSKYDSIELEKLNGEEFDPKYYVRRKNIVNLNFLLINAFYFSMVLKMEHSEISNIIVSNMRKRWKNV